MIRLIVMMMFKTFSFRFNVWLRSHMNEQKNNPKGCVPNVFILFATEFEIISLRSKILPGLIFQNCFNTLTVFPATPPIVEENFCSILYRQNFLVLHDLMHYKPSCQVIE